MIINHNYNESAIKQEIDDYLALIKKRGEDYGWNVVENKSH